jgi:hypothetical protein
MFDSNEFRSKASHRPSFFLEKKNCRPAASDLRENLEHRAPPCLFYEKKIDTKKLQTCRILDLRENLEHRAGNIWRALQSMRALTRIH